MAPPFIDEFGSVDAAEFACAKQQAEAWRAANPDICKWWDTVNTSGTNYWVGFDPAQHPLSKNEFSYWAREPGHHRWHYVTYRKYNYVTKKRASKSGVVKLNLPCGYKGQLRDKQKDAPKDKRFLCPQCRTKYTMHIVEGP